MEVLAESADLTGSKMLIVDTATTDRQSLESRLASWGVSADSADDATTALRLLRQGANEGRPYQAALLAGTLGGASGLDGLALAREIGSIPALRCTRLILLGDTPVDPAQARAAGIEAQLVKPIRQSRLYNQLLSTVRRARARAAPASRPVEGLPACTQRHPSGHPAPLHVLVAEDNEVNQFAAIRLLQTFGFSVDVARNGREAITMTGRRDYAAVFMDCQMPEMDGFSAARAIRLREQDMGGRIPIVALTANALEGDRDRCLSAGMDDYVAKPLRLQTIESLIERIPALRVPASSAGAADAAGRRPSTLMFDPGALVELGDPGLAAALAEMFLDQASTRVPALSAAIKAPDPVLLAQLAHGLQGSAATVGAQRMSELAEQLCEVATVGLMEQQGAALVAELTDALQDTSDALGEYLRTVNS
jgi:two-component system sensor histidine kinase/response regulator